MEPQQWIPVALGLVLAIAVVCKLITSQNADWTDIPKPLRDSFESVFPEFEILWMKHRASNRKYEFSGEYRGRDAAVVMQYDHDGALRELAFLDLGIGGVHKAEECELSELTPEVINHAGGLMGDERNFFKTSNVLMGRYHKEPAFKVAGQTPGWRWNFVLTAGGMLIEMAMTRLERSAKEAGGDDKDTPGAVERSKAQHLESSTV